MPPVKIIGFSAFSGTGKTALVEKLVLALKALGTRVAVIKHDVHGFEIDREGKDSWRFTQAGADMVILSSPQKTAVIDQRPHTLWDNLRLVHDVDLILVEGYKNEPIPQIGICRKAAQKGLPFPPVHYLAVVTDDETLKTGAVPRFALDEIEKICTFLLEHARPLAEILPAEGQEIG